MAHRAFKATYDLAVIGGGIVGLSAARQVLLRHPKLRVCVIEKENELATHQSKRNSGVVHAGIYYKKKTMKSRLCIRGAKLVKDYCLARGLPYKQCGKLIIATREDELENLHILYNNALDVGIDGVELVGKERVAKIQPGCTTALEAIWSPNTAIVDWQKVALSYAQDFVQCNGEIITNFCVPRLLPGEERQVRLRNIHNQEEEIKARAVVSCAGAFSDYLTRSTHNEENPMVVPFKGNYYMLSDRISSQLKTNIYPVPDPYLPFLGVHITPRVDGSALVGPTSLLTLGYERYSGSDPLNFYQVYRILFKSGVRKLIKENLAAGFHELYRLYSKSRVTRDVARFMPDIKTVDLIQTNFCGIRAQMLSKNGELVDDFLFETGRAHEFHKVLHVRNCPSPAATSSLAIGEKLTDILEERFI